jgi:hypothetical protein
MTRINGLLLMVENEEEHVLSGEDVEKAALANKEGWEGVVARNEEMNRAEDTAKNRLVLYIIDMILQIL